MSEQVSEQVSENDELIQLARDMVQGHYPRHREYKVASAFLELTAENEALRRDAERYRWIRTASCIRIAGKSVIRSPLKRGTPFLEFPNTVVAADFRGPDAPAYRDNFDAAIDKRIGEEKAWAARPQAENEASGQ